MKIKINKKIIEAIEGEKLIEVARRYHIYIPTLCYATGYQHHPSCMVCVVKNCSTNQILPACSTVVVQGMEIDTESNEVKQLQTMAIELLLSDHMATCRPPCKPKNCSLRKLALFYSAKWKQYPRYSAIQISSPQHIRDHFWFDVTKCIRCGLCVYNSNNGFTWKDRGFGMQVVLPNENRDHVDESLCNLCPTQALYKH